MVRGVRAARWSAPAKVCKHPAARPAEADLMAVARASVERGGVAVRRDREARRGSEGVEVGVRDDDMKMAVPLRR